MKTGKRVQKNFSGKEEAVDKRAEQKRKSHIEEVTYRSGSYTDGKARSYLIAKDIGEGAGQGHLIEHNTARGEGCKTTSIGSKVEDLGRGRSFHQAHAQEEVQGYDEK